MDYFPNVLPPFSAESGRAAPLPVPLPAVVLTYLTTVLSVMDASTPNPVSTGSFFTEPGESDPGTP